MKDFGGFEHNLQSLRVVDKLEQRYAEFDGLNLTFELREGILKHCSIKNARELGDVGERFLNKTNPSLEAQVTNFADEIAYNNHDIDDGLRSGLITIEQLQNVEIFATQLEVVKTKYPNLDKRRVVHETIRRMINLLVVDLCETTAIKIAEVNPQNINDIRQATYLVGFSESMTAKNYALKQFLRKNLYQHYKVNRMTAKANRIICELFSAFFTNPGIMPNEFQHYAKENEARAVADYIAGMTDRFAIREHRKLFAVEEYT
jgi:dGTPase